MVMNPGNLWVQSSSIPNMATNPYQTRRSRISSTWREIHKLESLSRGMMTWSFSNGESIYFLYDSWLRELPLSQYPLTINFTYLESLKVSVFIKNGLWDKEMLGQVIHPMILSEIIQLPLHPSTIRDLPIWSKSKSGQFQVQTAYDLQREWLKVIGPIWSFGRLEDGWHREFNVLYGKY